MSNQKKELSEKQHKNIVNTLKMRFETNMSRHEGIEWINVQAKIEADKKKLWVLNEMEKTGGEPDVVGFDKSTNEYIFFDCSTESPIGRRSLCYDREAWETRKTQKPKHNAMDMATAIGIDILSEQQYRQLQKIGRFDTKTSSWIKTPTNIRTLGGAIFADFRYGTVFVYHNGAESYYAARGFRGFIKV